MGNSAIWDFSLTATEMEAAQVNIIVADSATKAVDDTGFVIETYGHASAQHAFDLDTASTAQTGDCYARLGAPAGASVSADVAAVKAETASILTDTAEIGAAGAGLTAVASAANLATVAGYIDTEVAAILAAVDTEVAAIYTRLGAPAGASMSADIAAVKADTAATLTDTSEIGVAGAGLTAIASAANLATVAGYLDTEIAAILAAVDTEVAAIKAKTDNLPAAPAATGDCITAAGVRTAIGIATANMDTQLSTIAGYIDTEMAAALAAVDTEVAAIKAKTDNLPAAFPTNFSALAITAGGIVDADVEAITGDTGSAAKLKRVLIGNVTGTVGTGSTTTSIVTSTLNPAASVADQYKGRIITFDDATTTAALRGQSSDITANTSGGVLTVTALTSSAVSGDTFTIS